MKYVKKTIIHIFFLKLKKVDFYLNFSRPYFSAINLQQDGKNASHTIKRRHPHKAWEISPKQIYSTVERTIGKDIQYQRLEFQRNTAKQTQVHLRLS